MADSGARGSNQQIKQLAEETQKSTEEIENIIHDHETVGYHSEMNR